MIRENFLGTIKRSINQLAIISDVNTWFLIERLMPDAPEVKLLTVNCLHVASSVGIGAGGTVLDLRRALRLRVVCHSPVILS
jgi:hypothetical protein